MGGGIIINTKSIVIGGMLTGIATLFQVVPAMFTETFVFITIISSLPIYLASRVSISVGLTAFFATSILIWFLSPHEAIFFIFGNGPLGLSLGVGTSLIKRKYVTILVTAIVTTVTVSCINYLIGIKVFMVEFNSPLLFFAGLFMFLLLYSRIYLSFAETVSKYVFH